eukprot:Nk52_evm20s539 gene=Nk52_evmTU20s539
MDIAHDNVPLILVSRHRDTTTRRSHSGRRRSAGSGSGEEEETMTLGDGLSDQRIIIRTSSSSATQPLSTAAPPPRSAARRRSSYELHELRGASVDGGGDGGRRTRRFSLTPSGRYEEDKVWEEQAGAMSEYVFDDFVGGEDDEQKVFLKDADDNDHHSMNLNSNRDLEGKARAPLFPLVFIGLVESADAANVAVLWPLMPFLVASFEGVSEADVGYYSGLVASSYSLGQLFSNYFWGYASDRFGARVVLVFSLTCSALCLVAFGLCTTVWTAIFWRVLSGLLNGDSTVLKSYIGKVTDTQTQKMGVSVLIVSFSVGASIFTGMAGVMSNPAKLFPGAFSEDSLFVRLPYFLPILMAGIYMELAAIIVGCFVKEAEAIKEEYGLRDTASGSIVLNPSYDNSREGSRPDFANGEIGNNGDFGNMNEMDREESHEFIPLKDYRGMRRESDLETKLERGKLYQKLEEQSGHLANELETSEASLNQLKPPSLKAKPRSEGVDQDCVEIQLSDLMEMPGLPNYRRNMLLAAFAYALTGLITSVVEESVPLFAKLDVARGGLGYSTRQMGTLMTIASSSQIAEVILCVPWVLRFVGLRLSFKLCFFMYVPCIFGFPTMNHLASQGISSESLYLIFASLQVIRGFFLSVVYGAVILIVTNSVPENLLGKAHGIGQSLVAISRLVGPMISGSLFSLVYYSLDDLFLYKWYLWIVFSLFSLGGVMYGFAIEESMEQTFLEMAIARYVAQSQLASA